MSGKLSNQMMHIMEKQSVVSIKASGVKYTVSDVKYSQWCQIQSVVSNTVKYSHWCQIQSVVSDTLQLCEVASYHNVGLGT